MALDPRCPAAEDGFPDCNTDGSGVCLWCDYASCAACGAPVAAIEARRLHWVPGECAPGILCQRCLDVEGAHHQNDDDCTGHVDADGDCAVCHVSGGEPCPTCGGERYHRSGCADSDAVPEAVEEEETSAQTVRAAYEAIGDAGLGDVRATRKAAA